MFDVMIGLKDVASVETFPEAFRIFFAEVKKMVREGVSLYVLEQTNFIALRRKLGGDEVLMPMNISQAGKFAHEKGLIRVEDEKECLADPMPEMKEEEVLQAFVKATDDNVQFEIDGLEKLAKFATRVQECPEIE